MTPIRKALVVLVPVAAILVAASGLHRQLWYGRSASVAHDREERLSVVAEIAPAPLPTSLPLAGPPGRDADGEPTQHVDRPAFRSLLFHGAYADLTRYLERLQSEFEADPRCEYWPLDAADAFSSAEPELLAKLDAWAAATPGSFAPYLARAAYFRAVAQARRGGYSWIDTPSDDLAAMRDAVDRGLAEAGKALSLRPKLVAARRLQIVLGNFSGARGAEQRAIVDQTLAACPTCFQVRAAYLHALTPRWGGSHTAMDDFARSAAVASRPRLRLLAGYTDLDRARGLRETRQLGAAREAILRATALGDHWEFLLERAVIERLDDQLDAALASLDRAAAVRPGHPDVLAERARTRALAKRWEEAASDLLAVLRASPTDDDARRQHPRLVKALSDAALAHHAAGRREDALRMSRLAVELGPASAPALLAKAQIESGQGAPPSAIEVLSRAAREQPDGFPIRLALDQALARERRFDRVDAMWTEYLARHPEDGRAYLERGGARFHLGKRAEALADATRACELGVREGCEREKQNR